jgi:hypothetical protein
MKTGVPAYKRIVLKLSGEALQERGGRDNISPAVVRAIAERIKEVRDLGVQIAVVIGGGNIWRGLSASHRGMDRTTGDYMGMLATVINALALRSTLAEMGVETRVQTAIEMKNVAEPFILGRAIRHLELGRIVIFAAGTGNRGAPRERDSRRHNPESHESRWRLRSGPEHRPKCEALRAHHFHRSAHETIADHGFDRVQPLYG